MPEAMSSSAARGSGVWADRPSRGAMITRERAGSSAGGGARISEGDWGWAWDGGGPERRSGRGGRSGAALRTARYAAVSRRSPTDSTGSPPGATSHGSTQPPSRTSTWPTCGGGQDGRDDGPDAAGSPDLDPHAAAGRQLLCPRGWFGGQDGESGEVGTESVEDSLAFAERLECRAAAGGVVEQTGPGQPLEQGVDMTVGQSHPAAFLAQKGHAAGSVEEGEEGAGRGVDRAEYDGVSGCDAELDGIEVAPAAAQRRFQDRMHGCRMDGRMGGEVPICSPVMCLCSRSGGQVDEVGEPGEPGAVGDLTVVRNSDGGSVDCQDARRGNPCEKLSTGGGC